MKDKSMLHPSPTIIKADTLLGEGPLWCPRTQSLLWIDGSRPHLWRWRWGSDNAESWPLARPPAGLALFADGRVLIAFRARFGVVAFPGAPVEDIELSTLALGDERFNDTKVDRLGRLWIGTIDRALSSPIGRLYRIDESSITPMDEGFCLSNGIGWSPDNRTLYFSESYERLIHRYDFEAETGAITRAGTFVDLTDGPGKPDGLTVDTEGGVWCVIFGRSCVNRYLPDGRLDRSIELPVSHPTSCMLGGPDMRTLFVTTATYGLNEQELRDQPLAGSVFAFDVDVPGLAEPTLSVNCILDRAQSNGSKAPSPKLANPLGASHA